MNFDIENVVRCIDFEVPRKEWCKWTFQNDAGTGLQSKGVTNIGIVAFEGNDRSHYVLRFRPYGLEPPLQRDGTGNQWVVVTNNEDVDNDEFAVTARDVTRLITASQFGNNFPKMLKSFDEAGQPARLDLVDTNSAPWTECNWEDDIVWALDDLEETHFFFMHRQVLPKFPPLTKGVTTHLLDKWLYKSLEAKDSVDWPPE